MVFSKLFDEAKTRKKQPKPKESKPPRPRKKQKIAGHGSAVNPARNHHNNSRKRRGPPSAEALDFSRKLQLLARQKLLDQALHLYWSPEHDATRDEHHACIIVDCCARCGDVVAAESIVQKLQQHQGSVNVETNTALLKGYSHAGNMQAAIALFRKICSLSKTANVRTLNTLLRGCLWTAAAPCDNGEVAGGVVTSEQAWKLYHETYADATLDTSSYEYSISLLSQALHVKAANTRIQTFLTQYNIRAKGKASFVGGDQTALETLAVVHLGLARAYALLGKSDDFWTSSQRSLNALKASRVLLMQDNGGTPDGQTQGQQRGAAGGRRGWKNDDGGGRAFSNVAFRTHRLSELETEVTSLLKMRGKTKSTATLSRLQMAERIRSRLFYFVGGGTTGLTDSAQESKQMSSQQVVKPSSDAYLTAAWLSFGLSRFVSDQESSEEIGSETRHINASTVKQNCGLPGHFSLRGNGTIDFDKVFQDGSRPLDIEIGAGFGSWVVQQARDNTARNFVAVELRADRVFQIFSRATLDCVKPLNNICVVGAECGSFLRERVQKSSVSTIFANHPEPPTQTYGDNHSVLKEITNGGNEPAHMLNSRTIVEMGGCLESGGRIVVVSDNRVYLTKLLAATFAKVVREDKSLLRSLAPKELKDSTLRHLGRYSNCIDVYERQPNRNGSVAGTSYFDRLWRTGAGSHSEPKARFVLVMQRF